MSHSSTRFRLLVGSGEFWDSLSTDIAHARHRVWVQCMSLEGDSAGKRLARALKECPASDKRVLVDEFTKWVQSDRFLFSRRAMADRELQAEVLATGQLIRGLRREGVGVRWVSPIGFLGRRAAWRDHKKLLIIDEDVCYLGGINFTDHNFEWHDMMLRVQHPGTAAFCGRVFERAWEGKRLSEASPFDGVELISIDPPDLEPYERVWEAITGAREEIFIESAYITIPLSDLLSEAAARGVRVRVISPRDTNIPLFRRYITWEAQRSGFELHFLPGMTHMKAVLIDRRKLIMGSANLHFTGHWTQNEIVGIVTDSGVVQDFIRRVIEPDLEQSTPYSGEKVRGGGVMRVGMKLYGRLATLLGRGRLPPPGIVP